MTDRFVLLAWQGRRGARTLWLALLAPLLVSCATLGPDWEDPTVALAGVRSLPAEGMIPAFEIDLRVINPNAVDLELAGVVYTVSIQGHDLVKGVGKDFPVIEGYSEQTLTLTAAANLLAGIRMFMELAQENGGQKELTYVFEAKLDLAGWYPSIRVREEFRPGAMIRESTDQ